MFPHENLLLPALDVGDIILAPMTGAYTLATATDFNFFPRAKLINIDTQETSSMTRYPIQEQS